MNEINFEAAFRGLTGNSPFPWQRALYDRFVADRADNIPASCNLPTGLGKTSVIAVWLIALANHSEKMPRRLVYVVNRRTVVDQTTTEVERYAAAVATDDPSVDPIILELSQKLRSLTSDAKSNPLAISTLRGQFADNREWSADPSRPAVICGTVDMIGSRLLFSGYGISFKTRPLHAGFLGQDALVVHDEAHLEPAFQELLIAIAKEQKRCNDFRPIRVMELTATSRAGAEAPFELTDADHDEPEVKKRLNAKKTIYLHKNVDEKKLADEIADLTLMHKDSSRAVLVFVRKLDDVEKIVSRLNKEKQEVRQLTGTLRGLERDQLVQHPIFQRFLPTSNRNKDVIPTAGTVYLVSSSAGESGINVSADHLLSDLSTYESTAQRWGRANRFGERDDTRIDIVYPNEFDEDDYGTRLSNTLKLLEQLGGDGSPAALGKLDPQARRAAFTKPPTILPVSDILFDAWALTTILSKLPGRPPVEPYLHGVAEWQPPETHVAWREEVVVIVGDLLVEYPPKDLLEDYPLKPHELLGDNSARAFDRIKKLKADAGTPVWLIADDDSVEVTTLGGLIETGKDELNYKTVLLPPSAGGLENGFLTSNSHDAKDVADEMKDEAGIPRRLRVWDDESVPKGMRRIRVIDIKPDHNESEGEATGRRFWYWYESVKAGDGDGSKSNQKPVLLQVHTDDVVNNVGEIIKNLRLAGLEDASVRAAEWHDLGKRRKLFQRVLGNTDSNKVLAKSGKKGGRIQEQFRHEFGSLIDAVTENEFAALDDDFQEFVLHLIAAHHGRGRPHFETKEVFDPERTDDVVAKVAREVPRRFARLQRSYGRWGLAYLESLLRAADYAASARPSQFMEEEQSPESGLNRPPHSARETKPIRGGRAMTEPTATIRVNVDPTNPGQFFACCGLLELANRLWPDVEGWFEEGEFCMACDGTQSKLFDDLASCHLTNTMTEVQHFRFAEISSWSVAKRKSTKTEDEGKELEKLLREAPIVLKSPFNITLDWFTDDYSGGSRFKTWAGRQSVLDIASSMKNPLNDTAWRNEDCLKFAVAKCGLPFNFDSDLGCQGGAIDVGFSFDPLAGSALTRIESSARPALELLAFIGLQRFRPEEIKGENRFLYTTWNRPLPIQVAMPAACGALPITGANRHEFRLLYRTKYLKSFLPSIPFTGESDE